MKSSLPWWSQGIICIISFLYCFLLGASGGWLLAAGLLAWLAAQWSLRRQLNSANRLCKREQAGAGAAAVLFCAMLPVTRLTDIDRLYNAAVAAGLPGRLSRAINLLENAALVGLTLLLAYLACAAAWQALRRAVECAPGVPAQRPSPAAALLYGVPCLIVGAVYLYAYWPGILSPDSFDQWKQIDNLSLLADHHPVTHTLLEYAFTRLWYSPAAVALFQIVALALAWGWAMWFFESRGFRRRTLLVISAVFALLPYNGILPITLWKDIPYAIDNLLLVLLLGMVWISGGAWLEAWWKRILLGTALAFTYLMRHNGLPLLLVIPPALLLMYPRRWKAVLSAAACALILVLGIRGWLAFGLLKAQPVEEGNNYVLPVQHISAVVYHGGAVTPEQQAVMEKLAPLVAWKKAYEPYYADNLTKPWGYMKDPNVLAKIADNKAGILRTFAQMAVRYPRVVLRSEMDLMSLLWEITTPPGYHSYDFAVTTLIPEDVTGEKAALFRQPRLDTPLKTALDWFLLASRNTPLPKSLFWRGGIYLFLLLFLTLFLWVEKGARSLLIFLPPFANAAALFLAMPVEDFRYTYPIVITTTLLLLLTLASNRTDRNPLPAA